MNNGYRMLKLGDLRKKISLKGSSSPIFLVINSFVWYLLTYIIFNSTISLMEPQLSGNDQFVLFATYYISIAVTAILGSKLFLRRKTLLLNAWLLMGALATFFLIGLTGNNMPINFAISAFFGASIGIGLPSCLSYFANLTSVENRGSAGGVAWSAVGVGVLAFGFLISGGGIWAIIALTAWRLFGGAGFWILNKRIKFAGDKKPLTQKTPSYLELIRKREILLYLFPWVMFSLINFAEAPMLEHVFGTDLFAQVQIIEFAFIAVFAVLGGIAADLAGRKRVVIAGFVMLGIEYAALSVFSGYPDTAYLFSTLDGITWGLLFSVFFTTIWGDLGENQEKEKYYTLGGVPFLLAGFLSIIVKPLTSGIEPNTAFTLASFFLFVSVIPLMYAPETLPEKVMKDRDLKSYVDKAKKVVEKESEKKKEKEETEPESAEGEAEKPAENEKRIRRSRETSRKILLSKSSTYPSTMFFHVITTTECNLQCRYCFGETMDDFDEDFGDFELDYSLPRKADYDIGYLNRFCSMDPDCVVTFYGGEPLLNADFVRKTMDQVSPKQFMIQTNGQLLDHLEPKYVNRFHTILVSIDGEEALTDHYRGKGTFRKLIDNLKLITKNGFRGELIARVTVMEAN